MAHSMARRPPTDTVLAPRMAALSSVIAAAVAGDPEAVHQARVASRRLREVLPSFAVAHGGRAARHAVRRVTRALGPVRELDVALGHFEAAVAAHPLRPAALAAARRALQTARTTAFRAARATLTPARRDRLQAALEAFAVEASGIAPTAVDAAMAARLDRAARRLRVAVDRVSIVYAPGRLHDVRIAVKRLRYALEAVAAVRGTKALATRVRQLRHIQDLLGRAHDLHVLAMFLRSVQERVVARSRATARDLAALADELDVECRQLHAAFVSRRAALLTLGEAIMVSRPAASSESAA